MLQTELIDFRNKVQSWHCMFAFKPDISTNSQPQREREREIDLSIQPALAYEDTSMLESSAKVRMAAKQ